MCGLAANENRLIRSFDFQPDVGEQQRRRHRAVDARHPADGFGHRPSAIDRQHDAVVAFDAIFLRQQFDVARRRVPVDRAAVHSRLIFGERLELGAFAAQALLAQPEPAVALEQSAALVGDRAQAGDDADRAVDGKLTLLPDQPSGPAQRTHSASIAA